MEKNHNTERSTNSINKSVESSGTPQDASNGDWIETPQDASNGDWIGTPQDASASGVSLLDQIGGPPAIKAIVGYWILFLVKDPRISHYFSPSRNECMAVSVVQYLLFLLGAPGVTTYDESLIRKVHARMGINEKDFDVAMEQLTKSMNILEVDPEIQKTIADLVETKKHLVISERERTHAHLKDSLCLGGMISLNLSLSQGSSGRQRNSKNGDEEEEPTKDDVEAHVEDKELIAEDREDEGKDSDDDLQHSLLELEHFKRTLKAGHKKYKKKHIAEKRSFSDVTTNSQSEPEKQSYKGDYLHVDIDSDCEHEDLLLNRLGGLKAIRTAIIQLHDLIRNDERLGKYFKSFGPRFLIQHHKHVLAAALGKTEVQFGYSLSDIHGNLGITCHEFKAFADNVGRAFRMCGAADEVVDELMRALMVLRPRIVAPQNGDKEEVKFKRDEEHFVYDLQHFFLK